jgi:4-amino-4-deoxy-L-arabinose transferase-like glycosyltransferase
MPRLTANQTSWILILTVAVAVRLAAGAWWQSRMPAEQQFFFPDSHAYWILGHAIARGEPYEFLSPDDQVLRTPGYPVLLAGWFRVFGDDAPVLSVRAFSAVLGAVAVGVLGWWTTQLFDARAGRWAGWIAGLYPGSVSMGVFVLAEAPFCPWMLLQLALWGLAWRAQSNARAGALAVGGGIAGAIATLIRPSWLLFTPFALAIAMVIDRRRGRSLALGLAMCCSFAVCMLPWWIRNAHVTGHFVATTLQVGASLYDGWNPEADGGSNMAFVDRFAGEERAVDRAAADQDTFEFRLNRRMEKAALDWAWANPGRVAQLAWVKFARTWNVWPNEPQARSWPLRLAVMCTYVPLLCLGIVGAWRYTPWGWPYVLAWLPAVYFTLLHVVFVGSIRYREPAMLAVTSLAAGVLVGARRSASASNGGTTAHVSGSS